MALTPEQRGRRTSAGQLAKMTDEQRHLRAEAASNVRWAFEADRAAQTQAARDAMMAKWERQVDPQGVLDPEERHRRALHLRKAHLARMGLAAARKRAARKAGEGDG
jgi:hypothetical protein